MTERREPELLVLACDEAGRLSELTCAVTATRQGFSLEIGEVTTHGAWSAEQHDPREQQLRQALTVRLPAILDWLAFQQVDLRRGDGGMTAELPLVGVSGGPPSPVPVAVAGRWPPRWSGWWPSEGWRRGWRFRPDSEQRAAPPATPSPSPSRDTRRGRRHAAADDLGTPLANGRVADRPPEPEPVGEALADPHVGGRRPHRRSDGQLRHRLQPPVRLHRRSGARQPRRHRRGRLGGGGQPRRRQHRGRRRRRGLATERGGRSPSPGRPCPPVGRRRSASTYATTGRRPGEPETCTVDGNPCAGL